MHIFTASQMQDYIDSIRLTLQSSYKVNKIREQFRKLQPGKIDTRVIFIFGCQRSGTTLVQQLASLDKQVKMYGEGDYPHFVHNETEGVHKLHAFSELEKSIRDGKMPVITIKPLHDSHHANDILSRIENSLGIWVFRNFLDVIISHINYYSHNPFTYIEPLFSSHRNNWLNQNLPSDIHKFCLGFKDKEISKFDAYGLFWIARNSTYVQYLENNDRVLLISYDALVENPKNEIARMQNFIGLRNEAYYSGLVKKKNNKNATIDVSLNDEIFEMCGSIYEKLVNKLN